MQKRKVKVNKNKTKIFKDKRGNYYAICFLNGQAFVIEGFNSSNLILYSNC